MTKWETMGLQPVLLLMLLLWRSNLLERYTALFHAKSIHCRDRRHYNPPAAAIRPHVRLTETDRETHGDRERRANK